MLQAPVFALDCDDSSQVLHSTSDPIALVRSVLELPDDELDYATAKLAFDALVDPTIDREAVLNQLDELTTRARN